MTRPTRLLAAAALVGVTGLSAIPAPTAASVICDNINIWNASTTERVMLKRENGTTRSLQPQEETSGSYRRVWVDPGDDTRVTGYYYGGPTTIYYSDGWHQVAVWNCDGWNGYVDRVN